MTKFLQLKKPKRKIRYPGMIQFQAYFKPEIHQDLKVLAAMVNISMVKLVQKAVEGLLESRVEQEQEETREEILG